MHARAANNTLYLPTIGLGDAEVNPAISSIDAQPEPLSVTSHSVRFSTRLFSLDFSWQRTETATPPPKADKARALPAQKRRQGGAARSPSFQEVFRRLQLASLLTLPTRPRRPNQFLGPAQDPEAGLSPSPGWACRAYHSAAGTGTTSADRHYTA
ncbi:MAG: hypothetical protein PVG03_05270 [Desulfarculaceae bacterium]|jgi:hypothetical protein